jgi:hypothetical protein
MDEIIEGASTIRETELREALGLKAGRSLRDQLGFGEYLGWRTVDPN